MKDTTRRSLLAAGGSLAIGTVAYADQQRSSTNSEQEDDTEPEPMPDDTDAQDLVRVAHLAPDVGEITVVANGARGFESVAPLNESEYTTYKSNADYDISILEDDEVVHETTVSLDSGPVTLALVGEQCQQSDRPLQLLTLRDYYQDVASGMARMQTVHASPDAPEFDVRIDGQQYVSELSFGDSSVSDVPAGEHILGVYTSASDDPLFRFEVEFEEGLYYTTYAVGYTDMSNAPSAVPDGFSFVLGVSGGTTPEQ